MYSTLLCLEGILNNNKKENANKTKSIMYYIKFSISLIFKRWFIVCAWKCGMVGTKKEKILHSSSFDLY